MRQEGMLDAILVETKALSFPFPTYHPFERDRDHYERTVLLKDRQEPFASVAPVYSSVNVNAPDAVSELRRLRPDVVIVFGTGRVTDEIASIPSIACLNLHGGNSEAYRGLDSHLWAIYHRDFENLVTTIHFVSPELDTGDIVFSERLPISQGAGIHQLRAINAQVCVNLSILAIHALRKGLSLPSRRQQSKGRYYSAMPAVLKQDCADKFARFTRNL